MFYQILALIIWSSSFIAAKYAYAVIDPALMVGVRLLIAALLVLPVCRRYIGKIPRREWKPLPGRLKNGEDKICSNLQIRNIHSVIPAQAGI